MKKKALAIKYTDGMGAPLVIAQSRGKLTEKLLEIAREHDIPVLKDKNIADNIFELPLGIIPEAYYEIFAELLAFVYHLQGRI